MENQQMHVIQVTPRYSPNIGGVETVVQKISETLVENDIDVTVYSVDSNRQVPRQQRINQVFVKRFSPLLGDPFFLPEPKFITDFQHEKADIIHVHNVHTLPPFLIALAKDAKQKILLQPHYHRFGQSAFRHSLFGFYKYALKNIVFPSADLTITNSSYEERALREDFPELKNTTLLPEGMDTNEARHIKHHPVRPHRVLYVGGLIRYKNVDKIFEGFSYFLRRSNESKLVIVGDGPERKFLVSHAHSLGLDPFVEWKHGLSRERLLDEYARASVFILLSHLESFSRVVYDALLTGVPVVVLNFGALEDLVRTGLAIGVDSLDPQGIAGALLEALERSPPKFPNGTNTFLEWPEYSKRIIDMYYELLDKE
jgi:glycosyltransferase involved in cell wall biosynthesis